MSCAGPFSPIFDQGIRRLILLLGFSETDFTFPLESRRRAEDLLIAAKAKYHIQVFSGVSHGFAVRGNPDVEQERECICSFVPSIVNLTVIQGWAKEESARGVISWFNRFTATNKELQ